ncbi:MAG: glutamate racemase [Candidatus Buchananbacteria bacterium]|nr:glutamate racemase [Candidatus Buchananbacteria bacterium]
MIGIFDSGIGGLTVVKAIRRVLPAYQLMYLGDTARTPYGNRSQEKIYEFTVQAVDYLFKQGCGLVIVACNTASAEALRKLQQEWLPIHYPDRRVLGVIRPVVEVAVSQSRYGRLGVLGTRATVNSGAYERELRALDPKLKIWQAAAPLLVPLIEEGWLKRPETIKIARLYLRELKTKKIDTLILGCTHYPMLHKKFQSICGKNIKVLDVATIVAEKLKDYLNRHPETEQRLVKGTDHRFLVTDITDIFAKTASVWLGEDIRLEKVNL